MLQYLNGTDYTYWKACIQACLEAVDLECWAVTNEDYGSTNARVVSLAKANGKAKNILFDGIFKDELSRIDANCSALEIWTTICDILEVSFNVKEESYYVRKNNYENLAMLTNKNVNKVTLICMYLWSKSTP
jgi:hypothetical protein